MSPRPQPPALPHQCRGWDPLPDGGRDSRHDVAEGVALGPGSDAFLPGDHRGASRHPLPQPGRHLYIQRPAAVEALPRLRPAARVDARAQGTVRARCPPGGTKRLIDTSARLTPIGLSFRDKGHVQC